MEKESKTIRIGIVGCGRVAENHVEAIQKTPNAVLTAAAGGRKAAAFCEKHGLTLLDTESICTSPEIDALLVLTPWEKHYEYAKAALEAGKHVLVEKPVSFQPEEIKGMKQAAEENKVVCMPGHSYLYLTELSRIRREVRNGGIGSPAYLYLSETYYMAPELFQKYDGPEVDVLCHQLYLSLAFLGIPESVSAFRSGFDRSVVETGGPQIIVNLKYGGGCLAQIMLSWAAEDHTSDPWTFKVKVLGTQGSMHFSRRDYVRNVGESYDQVFYQEMFDAQMNHFVNHCILGGEQPLSTIQDAGWVCRLHNLILQAADTEQVVQVL